MIIDERVPSSLSSGSAVGDNQFRLNCKTCLKICKVNQHNGNQYASSTSKRYI
jgi:hypothetical protein